MARLLVVHHSPTPGTRLLLDQVVAGAHDDAIEGVEVEVVPALEAGLASAEAADGFLLGTSANFGYMSGALKHFFDAHFLALGGALADADPGASALRWSDLADGFPFRVAGLPVRDLHRRVKDLSAGADVVIADVPQVEDHAGIARSAMRI